MFSITNITYANENVVGVWASPNIKSAEVLWFFYPDGKVRSTSNTAHNKHIMTWGSTNNELTVITNPKISSHKWVGSITGKKINAVQSFVFKNKLKTNKWSAEKYSNNPDKKVNFYSLCSNKNYVWTVVNVGNFEKCLGTVPWEKTTSFSHKEAKKLCEPFIAKRKKERKFKVEEKCE